MNLSKIFIERPVATSILVAAIIIFGVIAFRTLPVNELPNVDFPTIQVTSELRGANPEVMASSVATPLERQFSTIAGVETMNSVSTTGRTREPGWSGRNNTWRLTRPNHGRSAAALPG